jgi:dUTP pyrophosphatase
LDDQGDELAEEIMAPNNIEEPRELGVPIRFVQQPDYEMVDLSQRPVATTSSQNQTEAVSAPGPSQGSPSDMETCDKDKGTKRPVSDSEGEARKQPRLRPRRNREQLREEEEKKRKREERRSTEDSDEQRKPSQPFPLISSGMAQYLPLDTTSDSDAIEAVRTLEVEVAAGSDIPARSTELSAAYDVKAFQTIVIPPYKTGVVALNLRLATPNDHFMYLMSRSGLALKGITIEGGVIDPDYHQDVKAIVRNNTPHPFKVQKGQRIAQAIFLPIVTANFNLVDRLRNEDGTDHPGFGSTGEQ